MPRTRSAALVVGSLLLLIGSVANAQTEHYDHVSAGFAAAMRGGGVMVVGTLRAADRSKGAGELQVDRVMKGKAAAGALPVQLVFAPLTPSRHEPAPGEGSWQVGMRGVWQLAPATAGTRALKVMSFWASAAQYPGIGIPATLAGLPRRDWSPPHDGLAAALLWFHEMHGTHLYAVLTLKNVGRTALAGYLGADSELIAYGQDRLGTQVLRRFTGADFVRRARPAYPTLQPGDQLHLLVGFVDCAAQSVAGFGDTVWAEFRSRAKVRGRRTAGQLIPRAQVPWHEMRCPAVVGAPAPVPPPPAPAPPAGPWPPAAAAAPADPCADHGPAGQWQAMAAFPQAGRLAAYEGTMGKTDGRVALWKAGTLYVVSARTHTGHAWDPCADRWSPTKLADLDGSSAMHNGASLVDTQAWVDAPRLSTGLLDFSAAVVHMRGASRPVSSTGAPTPRHHHIMATDGQRLVILGGRDDRGTPVPSGAWLDLPSMTWHPLPAGGPPLADDRLAAFYYLTGNHLVIAAPEPQFRRLVGHIFDFQSNRWTALSAQDAPLWDTKASALGSGGLLMVMSAFTGSPNHAAILDVARNRWRAVTRSSAPLGDTGIGGHEIAPGKILLVRYGWMAPSWAAVADLAAGTVRDLGIGALGLSSNADLRLIWTGKRLLLWGGGVAKQTGTIGDGGCHNVPPGVGCDPVPPMGIYHLTPHYHGFWLRP